MSILASSPDLASSRRAVHDLITRKMPRGGIQIYEAGGGSVSYLPPAILEDANVCVVDIDQQQLQRNTYADSKILGDVQTHAFPSNSFDLVVCYNVIEHLQAPDAAIRLFHRALKPGGLLFIGAPNPNSLPGLVTRLTPHAFHVWYYRRVLREKDAGGPGNRPFKTFFEKTVKPKNLARLCDGIGLELVYMKEYRSPRDREMLHSRPVLSWAFQVATGALNALSLGRRNFRNGDYHALFEKRAHVALQENPARAKRDTGVQSARHRENADWS